MTHAPKYWSDKLPAELRPLFWSLIGWGRGGFADHVDGFSGEDAYYRVLESKSAAVCPIDGISSHPVHPVIGRGRPHPEDAISRREAERIEQLDAEAEERQAEHDDAMARAQEGK